MPDKQSIAFPDYNENLNKFVSNVEKGVSLLSTVKVTDNDSVIIANDTIQKAMQLKSALDKAVESITRPAKDLKKEIDNWQSQVKNRAVEIYKPLEVPVESLKKQLLDYNKKQEEIKRLAYQRQQRVNALNDLGCIWHEELGSFKYGDNYYPSQIADTDVDFLSTKKEILALIEKENKKSLDLFEQESNAAKTTTTLSSERFQERLLAVRQLGAISRGQDLVLFGETIDMTVLLSTDDELFMAYYEKLMAIKSSNASQPASPIIESPKISGITNRWTFEVTDESLVPRQYCEVSDSLINKAIKEGIRDIPGVRIFQEQTIKNTRRAS